MKVRALPLFLLLAAVIAAAAACQRESPGLTMTFAGLPDTAGDITVRLSSPGSTFAGAATNPVVDGGLTVTHPGDGTITVTINRATVKSQGDQQRLQFTSSVDVDLHGAASAVDGATLYTAVAQVTVHPAESATLAFQFGAVIPDAGAPSN